MKIIKNNLKLIVISLLVGILFSCISVYSYHNYIAKDVVFTPDNQVWNVNNVEQALNDLYSNLNLELEFVNSDSLVGTSLSKTRTATVDLSSGNYIIFANEHAALSSPVQTVSLSSSDSSTSINTLSSESGGCLSPYHSSSSIITVFSVKSNNDFTLTITGDDGALTSGFGGGLNYIVYKIK